MHRFGLLVSCALICTALTVAAEQAPRAARPSVRQEPGEFTGPPKPVPPAPSAVMRRFAESKAINKADKEKPGSIRAAIEELSAFTKEFPKQPDFYLMRAALACQTAPPDGVLVDLVKAQSLIDQGNAPFVDQTRDLLSAKAKAEFRLGKYEDALRDLDAAIRIDYDSADGAFNDGTVKLHTVPDPCSWTVPDFDAMAKRLPTDFRPPLFGALYRLSVFKYNHESDYSSVIEALNSAAKLDPASPLPNYFLGRLHTASLFGSPFSMLTAKCIDDVVPRTADCVKLDEVQRLAVRYFTRSIAVDTSFMPAYAARATMFLELKDFRQAVRDYDRVLELKPDKQLTRIVYNDRALAKMQLNEYASAVADFTKSIALGCEASCNSYDNRANAFMKLGDYQHALADTTMSIRRVMEYQVFGINIDGFRKIYPEYDDVADDALAEKLRVLFYPQFTYAVFSKQFLIEAKMDPTFVLVDMYLRRGDIYAKLGQMRQAETEYDRVSRAFPEFAKNAFEMRNGKRVRITP